MKSSNITYLIMLYIPHIFNFLIFLFSKDINTKVIVIWSTIILLAFQFHKKIKSWFAYCLLGAIPIVLIHLWTVEFFFVLSTVTILFIPVYILVALHHVINDKLKLGIYISVVIMLMLSLVTFLVLFFVYYAFLIKVFEQYPSNNMLLYISGYLTWNMLKTLLVALFTIIIAYYVFESLFKLVKTKVLNNKSRYQIIFIFLFSLFALIFPDMVFSYLYLSFAETSESLEFLHYADNFDIGSMIVFYSKAFYYTFCLHFAVPMPTTEFYFNMQNSIMNNSYMKILQFLHYIQNKLLELHLFAAGIATLTSNALGLEKKEVKEN
ncbi:hypothetical protein HW560_00265 [Paenibacillus sp. E222]|uniref:hypothetical protein n=1 Tax=Paenibacillus sp. E222 TaxID=2748863 RepID=UPI0015C5F1CE|nr:hypothetical protein [Paenibacillus sp. E222]QLG36729.1 hypothetical protein HW560_00265 [Paenibacillus sp. E222]